MAVTTFLASFGLIGLRIVEKYGIDAEQFSQQLGLATIGAPEANRRLSSDVADRGFKRAMLLIPDPAFALRAGECWHPSHLGTLGYAWLSSGSLHTALDRLQRFIRIVAGSALLICSDTAEGMCITYETGRGDTPLGHTMADFGLSLVLTMCRTDFAGPLNPLSVNLRRPEPANRQPYDQFFCCPVSFGATANSFVLSSAVVDFPLHTANRELAQIFDDILVGELARVPGADLHSRCKAFLLQDFTSGEPSEERLAESMAMSRRTLQRKLADIGLSYRGVLDSARYELALKYLADAEKSLTEIAFLLGFSEHSAFTRAFKRWHGIPPANYREQLVVL